MKKILVISYWVLAVILVAAVMLSVRYNVGEALLFGTLFLPGALVAKYSFSKIAKGDKSDIVKNTIFISIGIIVGEFLLFMLAQYSIGMIRKGLNEYPNLYDLPSELRNPAFVVVIIAFLAIGSVFVDRFLEKKYPAGPKKITFLSDRRSVTLLTAEILYVESLDTITVLHATEERSFRNTTPISQWESILDDEFIRIHRSFLVNRDAITSIDKDVLYVGEEELPISRKYKDSVSRL